MFDKSKFAQILKNINDTYNSQRDFSKKSEINRTYLSQYMNMKLDEPPKPKILKKIADNSNEITTYEELMTICGYIDNNNSNSINNELIFLYEKLNNIEKIYENRKKELTFQESQVTHELFNQVMKCVHEYKQTPETFNPNELVKSLEFLPNKSKNKISKALQGDFEYFYYKNVIRKQILNLKLKNNNNCDSDINLNIREISSKTRYFFAPVYRSNLSWTT